MAGAEAQAGFYYQNVVAAGYALDLLEFGSSLRSITLESIGRAKHIDDIVADYTVRTTFVQVKWAQDQTSALTLHNFVTAEEDSTSLLSKLARGYQQIRGKPGQKEIVLFSSRRAGINRQPGLGFTKSLTEFLDEFHRPLVAMEKPVDIERLAAFDDYRVILESLGNSVGLPDIDELLAFLKCVRFKLNQPDIETMTERVCARLAQLGIEQRDYATLLNEIVNWSITNAQITPDDVRRVLGVHDRFVDRVSHHFPLDQKVWVATPRVFAELDSSIEALDSGFILLEGEPGSGKSTALTAYIEKRSEVSFGYYCFVPNDRALANERLEREAFVSSICIGLRNAFPEVKFPKPYARHTVRLLNDWLHALSAAKQRVVFVVDGLDHVDRKSLQSMVAHPLTTVLDAGNLPSNVLIVLSSRYLEALPESIVDHVNADPRRRIMMPRFETSQVRRFLKLRGVVLSDEMLEPIVTVSGGVPIYLEYLADQIREMNRYEQKLYLDSVPSLRDDTIDAYHRQLWATCRDTERLVYILAILATRDEFTTAEILRELLEEVGVDSTLYAVHQDIRRLRHVLRVSDAESFAIRHSSLAEFVIAKTAHLKDEVNQSMVAWYDQNPDSDDAWRNQLRHMWDCGKYLEVLSICDDGWLGRAWELHRPFAEIQRNLDIAWRVAAVRRDLLEFIRVALMKQRVAIVLKNLEVSDVDIASLLLQMGKPKDALRKAWDGERRQCSQVEFAEFCLDYVAMVGRTPPDYIMKGGLGDEPSPGANVAAIRTFYRAQSLVGDPVEVLEEIGHIRWRSKDHLVKSPVNQEDSERTNFELQMAVLRELMLHERFDSLEQVLVSETLPEALRVAARGMRGLVLVRKGERLEAVRVLKGLDLTCLCEKDQRWLFLRLADVGLDDVLMDFTSRRPELPRNLLDSNEQKFNDAFLDLYDRLRCFFLRDETGFPWFEAITTAWPEPARTLVTAIGHLARLWTNLIRRETGEGPPLKVIKDIATTLDLRKDHFPDLKRRYNHTFSLYREKIHHLFEQVWSCAKLLSDDDLLELGRWWTTTREAERALYNPEATRKLARTIHGRTQAAASVCQQLLEIAERRERMDEETSAIGLGLFTCASAWAECGFPEEAQRLWRELLDVACGIYWRKDYQFNEILTALALAHEEDPDGTLKRVQKQLALAHQLVGTSEEYTVSLAFEGLIRFLSKVDPVLALEALHREEKLIHRDRAIQRIIRPLLDKGTIDCRLVLSLPATIVDTSSSTIFEIYSTALHKGEIATARSAYDLGRHVLLIEKQRPAELGRWAAVWVEIGGAPLDVKNDNDEYSTPENQGDQEPHDLEDDDDILLSEELDALADDLGRLDARLEEGISEALRKDRKRELERFQRDFRSAYSRAAGNSWPDNVTENINQRFAEFIDRVIEVDFAEKPAVKAAVRDALRWLVSTVSEQFSDTVSFTDFEDVFDIEEWLDRLVRARSVPYQIQQILKDRLPQWISKAPLADLNEWEDFCRCRCTDDTRATGLLALAERRLKSDPDRAVCNLIAAGECISTTFYNDDLVQRICTRLFDLDEDKGAKFLFESFRQQHSRFSDSIIDKLDRLLDFADRLGPVDKIRLYEIWSSHNQHLAAGLSAKAADVSWLHDPSPLDFQQACLKYLVRLFDYPVVDVRLLALDELFRLSTEYPDIIPAVLNFWSDLNDGQKEYVASLAFSIGLHETALAEQWMPLLVELVQQEQHRNLRATIAEAVEFANANGATFTPEILTIAGSLKVPPRILVLGPALHWEAPRSVWLPPYLRWSLGMIAEGAAAEDLEAKVQALLSRLYLRAEHGCDEEMAVHRDYNINTNFDSIEIGGPYDSAARSALNRSVQMLVNAHELDHRELKFVEDVLRLRDPSDILVRKVQRPTQVCWIEEGITDEDFLEFRDLDDIKSGYALRDGDWVTIFEHTEQRIGENYGSDPQRATKVRVIAFGVPQYAPCPTLSDVQIETGRGSLLPIRNRYRFELSRTVPPTGQGSIVPIVVVTSRAFRGRNLLNMAALAPDLAESLSLVGADDDLLGLVDQERQKVVRSIEWQEAFDQGRRRHEPRSAGFLLQIKRDNLRAIAEREGLNILASISVKRTTDRYKPEDEMHWRKSRGLFPLEMSG